MNSKPICGKWHSGNVIPREFEPCIFEIKVNDKKEMIIGCWRRGKIVKINESYDYVCDTDAVVRWCYTDLN